MIFSAETEGLLVEVEPTYLERHSKPQAHEFVWAYKISVTNKGTRTVKLLNRHWEITDGAGRMETVDGPGVVGRQPELTPGDQFEYQSFCPLKTPSGFMVGRFEMVDRSSGQLFWITVPAFSLDSPHAGSAVN